jgi:F-type H+-transporting ATPase subunit delta
VPLTSTGIIARRYAVALFRLAKDVGELDRIGRDLQGVVAVVQGNADIRRFFVSPIIDRGLKATIFERTLHGCVDRMVLNALLLLVRKRRESFLPAIAAEYQNLVFMERNREPLDIVSARPLAADELERMITRLSRVYGKQFAVSAAVDASILGGVRFAMGDRHIDGSVSGCLDELARELFSKI